MKTTRWLWVVYLALVLVKIGLSTFVATPTIYSDEYLYAKLARSLATDFTYSVHGVAQNGYPPLYPLVLSVAYLFQDMHVVYFVMQLLNALVSSLILFPFYFLARLFLDSRESFSLSLLVGVLPSSFAFAPYLMAENLFFVLFLTTVYFLFKATAKQRFADYLFAGLFFSFTVLTKTLGLLLLPLFGVLFLRAVYRKHGEEIRLLIFSGLVSVLAFLPWLAYTAHFFGLSVSGFLGSSYESELGNVVHQTLPFLIKNSVLWLLFYSGVFILTTGVLFALGTWFFFREKKSSALHRDLLLFVSVLLVTVFVFVINHNLHGVVKIASFLALSGRPIIRYLDVLLPLLFLTGYLGLRQHLFPQRKHYVVPLVVLLLSFPLMFYSLFPVNNLSLTWLGVLAYGLRLFTDSAVALVLLYVLIVVFFVCLVSLIAKAFSLQSVVKLFAVFFFCVSLLSIGITIYNSSQLWYPKEQVQLGLWLGENVPAGSRVVVDAQACTSLSVEDADSLCSPAGHTTLLGFWVNRDIIISSVVRSGDYFVSRTAPSNPLHITENHIYISKVH